MLNIEELEERWLRYTLKRKIPLFLITLISISAIIGIGVFILNKSTDSALNKIANQHKSVEEVSISKSEEVINAVNIIKDKVPSVQNELKTIVLKPALAFERNQVLVSDIPIYIPQSTLYKPTVIQSSSSSSIIQAENQVSSVAKVIASTSKDILRIPEPDNVNVVKTRKNELVINKRNSEIDLQDVINRFKKNRNPKLSLHIAKKYYSLGKYDKSYNYALMTNQIDEEIEDSWIIFAKSLYKLGEEKMAIKTLNSYIKSSESIKASLLLNNMKKGIFQ